MYRDGDTITWGTGESSEYQNWAEGEPSGEQGLVAMVRQSNPAGGEPLSRWVVTASDEELYGIVELDSIDKLVTWDTGDLLTVTIENAAPRVDLSGPEQVDEGSNFTLSVGPSGRPRQRQGHPVLIDWGDDSEPRDSGCTGQ